jgi:DNA-binding PadR family transcriptional regulator
MIGTLEFFILFLIHRGIDTPYEIQVRAAFSVGSTLPAFRRLLDKGLVTEAERGPRGRRQFALTAKGKRELQNSQAYFSQAKSGPAGDLESTLRLTSLAFISGEHKLASEMLLRAANECDSRSVRARTLIKGELDKQDVGTLYQQLLAGCEADRQAATGKRLRGFASELESKTAKRTKSGSRWSVKP